MINEISNKNRLTASQLKEKTINLNEHDAIVLIVDYVNSYYPKKEIKKPILTNGATSEQVMEYAKNLKLFEDAKQTHDIALKEYKAYKDEIYTMLENYIIDAADLKSVPDIYQNKVYRLAYQNGHSNGMYSVYQNLLELVEIFN